jgi:hypothetical protein
LESSSLGAFELIPQNSKAPGKEECRLKDGRDEPINLLMGNAISILSSLTSTLAAQSVGTDVAIATLRKSNDVAKQEGAALVQMLNELLPQADAHSIDTYA